MGKSNSAQVTVLDFNPVRGSLQWVPIGLAPIALDRADAQDFRQRCVNNTTNFTNGDQTQTSMQGNSYKNYLPLGWHSLLLSWLALIALIAASLATAQNADDLPKLVLDQPLRPIFAGSWERDFTRSDNWETELERMLLIRQEALERMRRQSSTDLAIGQGPSSFVGGGGGRRGGANIIDLARLAEYISRQTTLNITQTRFEVRIGREGDATLICGVEDGTISSFSSVFGSEICGWDRNQLVFQTRLPDDLSITHRFSVSSDGQMLSMVISLTSRGSESFNLRQSFNRYSAPADEFDCTQTISRGRVCSQSSTVQ